MIDSILQVQNVSLNLGRSPRLLLSDISFELRSGEIAILLGPQRSGKTLLLQLLNGLRSPSQGQILWRGQALSAQPPVALRRQIVYQPQQPRLLGMTGREAIAYPLHLQGLSNSIIQQRLATWLDILEIPLAWLEQREAELTPLATQAIALARSLVMEPQLLLLDNPWPPALVQNSPSPDTRPDARSSAWEQPENRIKQALDHHKLRGGTTIWAMTPEKDSGRSEAEAIAQRILLICSGCLLGNQIATAAAWQESIAQLAQVSSTSSVPTTGSETDEWD